MLPNMQLPGGASILLTVPKNPRIARPRLGGELREICRRLVGDAAARHTFEVFRFTVCGLV